MVEGWGVDGCRRGWFYFGLREQGCEFGVVDRLEELIGRASRDATILVDIPIGLRESEPSGRGCDVAARRALRPTRSSSVFPAPSRQAVYAPDYETASRLNRASLGKGLSKQSWAITPKIREVDELLARRPELRGRLREAHPEVCFWGLTGTPMGESKKSREGFRARLEALSRVFPSAADLAARAYLEHGGVEAARDDVLDALVTAVCATRIGGCRTLPESPELDPRGLPMEIVYLPRSAAAGKAVTRGFGGRRPDR